MGVASKGVDSQDAPILVGDPEPTPLSAKSLLYLCGRFPEGSESGTRGWEKQPSNRYAGVVQLRKPKTGECGEKQKEKESKNCSEPEKLAFLSYPWQSATPPLRHSSTPPPPQFRPSCLYWPH